MHAPHEMFAEFHNVRFHDEKLHELEVAFKSGLLGTLEPMGSQSASNTVLAAAQTSSEVAQCWQVTLAAMDLARAPVTPNPAASISNLQQRNEVIASISNAPAKITVQFGTGNVMEVAECDYPFGGCTFEVRAANLRVMFAQVGQNFTTPSAAVGLPMLGAFISPGTSRSKSLMPPTWTTAPNDLDAAGGAAPAKTFCAPKRAVGYRVWMTNAVTTSSMTITQGDYTGSGSFQTDFVNADMRKQPQGVMPDAQWIALNPRATAITITNIEAAGRTVGVTWILDFG